MKNLNLFRNEALRLGRKGYPVFPCQRRGKAPITANGLKDATCDRKTIREWWADNPHANIGLLTNDVLVIDLDKPKDGSLNLWSEGKIAKELARVGVMIKTGSGVHYYFKNTGGWGCSVGKLAPSVDVRGVGGYVITSPSVHENGTVYEGESLPPIEELPAPPEWLCEKLDNLSKAKNADTVKASKCFCEGERNSSLFKMGCILNGQGYDFSSILDSLLKANSEQCSPPLEEKEVDKIAKSASSYHSKSTYRVDATPKLQSFGELKNNFQGLSDPIIDGLLRVGETANLIGAPKAGKSCLVQNLAISVATGRDWLGFSTPKGKVLLLDNELQDSLIIDRSEAISKALDLNEKESILCDKNIKVDLLRGRGIDMNSLDGYLSQLPENQFDLIILDALYRFIPADKSENDNTVMTHFYNILSKHSERLGGAFLVVHHTSKGRQSSTTTDIGSGAGAMSRAADTHITITPKSVQDCSFIFRADCRSWKHPKPFGVRACYPIVLRDDSVVITNSKKPAKKRISIKDFVKKYVSKEIVLRDKIISNAANDGVAESRAEKLLKEAEASSLVDRHSLGKHKKAAFCLVSN